MELLIPKRFHNSHHGYRENYVENPRKRAMGEGLDLYCIRKDGSEFPVAISLSPMKLPDEDQILVICAIRDITHQKAAESEIRNLNENLEKLVAERTADLHQALLHEKEAREESMKYQSRLQYLSEASELLTSSLDYLETFENITQLVIPDFADLCLVGELNHNGTLNHRVVSHINPEKTKIANQLSEKLITTWGMGSKNRPGVNNEIVPELFTSIQEETLDSITQDLESQQILKKIGIKSAMILPLVSHDKIYGILMLGLTEDSKYFNGTDFDFAKELARRAAIAIENANLYKEQQNINSELEKRVALRTNELDSINKELEAFSYSVSHDLRAPLRSIDGFSNKILKEYADRLDDQGKDYFNRVMKASRQMGNLIDDLLQLARLSRIDISMQTTNLSSLAEAIAEELKIAEPERVVNFHISSDLMAKVDQRLFQLVLQNLLGNAWKYSRNQPVAEIEFSSKQVDDQKVYFIKDNGVGFDMEYAGKLFGAFQRLHSSSEFEGNGIGLATVQRIIRRHNGKIWTESEVNKGATFYFTL